MNERTPAATLLKAQPISAIVTGVTKSSLEMGVLQLWMSEEGSGDRGIRQ